MYEVNSALRDDESNASSLNALRACHQGERESDDHPILLAQRTANHPHNLGLNLNRGLRNR